MPNELPVEPAPADSSDKPATQVEKKKAEKKPVEYLNVLNVAPATTDGPAPDWSHRKLYIDVRNTLRALPDEFSSSIELKDFRATDIFTLNSALGASIEDAVVRGLNKLREVWDPDQRYPLYRFERQSQTFPDVRLVTDEPSLESPLIGIELKGWFALAKEGEPTFRYQISADACARQDLLVVFPWVLSDVVAGTPKLLPPFVGEARYAAQLRNYYWQHLRETEADNRVIAATHLTPYPSSKVDQCSDRAAEDGGGNFGRVSRYGLMGDFLRSTGRQQVSGIPVKAWHSFFRLFSDKKQSIDERIAGVEAAYQVNTGPALDDIDTLIKALEVHLEALRGHRRLEEGRLAVKVEEAAIVARKKTDKAAVKKAVKKAKKKVVENDGVETAFGDDEPSAINALVGEAGQQAGTLSEES